MARFLSEAWCDEIAAALSGNDEIDGVTFTLQQVVKDAPDGKVAFWTTFADGTVTAGIGTAPSPDVTLTQDYGTAAELARGELVAQAAFMQGKLKVTGNMGSLLTNQKAIAALGSAMAGLQTDF